MDCQILKCQLKFRQNLGVAVPELSVVVAARSSAGLTCTYPAHPEH
jgi:hypothetical protein